ncbi:hypothetical protein LINPERHAP1_LOCUS20051 [Linum perenne]
MSTENEEKSGLDLNEEAGPESQKSKLLYTREFLLSLSELDVCKRLPSGFDQSLLSEFEDTSQDRFRISGGLPSQGYKRTEYGSSPPTRGDSSNFSRGIHGRWDSRSSARSDRDSDSQSDMESDSGRRYGNQSRRAVQVPEHDGLLGSGSFPRPPGFAVGSSTSKFRVNSESHQLSKSNEPYQPPRPYKAGPLSRRETNDSFNDETFGSSESTNEDREEEERKRRDSFELLRKEQHKAFLERQKLNPGKGKDDFMSSLVEDSKDDKRSKGRSSVLDGPVPTNDSKPVISSAPVSRPLVPPGFVSAAADKSAGTKATTNPQLEVVDELEGSLLHSKVTNLLNGASYNQERMQPMVPLKASDQQLGNIGIDVSVNGSKSSAMDTSSKLIGKDAQFYETPKLLEVPEKTKNGGITEPSPHDMMKGKFVHGSGPPASTSILDKLFGNALALDGGDSSSSIEPSNAKVDDKWISSDVNSSKFAQWFLEEEKNQIDDVTSCGSNNLLSLIGGGEKGLPHAFDGKTTEQILPDLSVQNSAYEGRDRRSSSVLVTAADTGKTKHEFFSTNNNNKPEEFPAVLTCEDLEQSILSEIPGSGSSLPATEHGWNVGSHQKAPQQKANVDDHAAQHLLSLLQKGTSLNFSGPSAIHGTKSVDSVHVVEEPGSGAPGISIRSSSEHSSASGKPLTLETLFGTAFMKELQPVGVPIASEKGKAGITKVDGPESHGISYPEIDAGLLRSTSDMASNVPGLRNGVQPSNQWQQIKSDRTEEQLVGFHSRNKADSSQIRSDLVSRLGGLDASGGIGFPEEDNLIKGSHHLNPPEPLHGRSASNKIEGMAIEETGVGIAEKLAALNAPFRDERLMTRGQEGPPFGRSPYDMRELEVQYQNMRVRPSPQQLHAPQMNHAGSMFHQFDSHSPNTQMKFMSPENIIHRDAPNNLFPGNMLQPPFHQPNNTITGFNPSPQNPLLQQMHMTGNFPPHMSHGFPRGAPGAQHPNSQMPGFTPDGNSMQGFPFGQRQPNLGPLGMPPHGPGVDSGTSRPDPLQMLMEMELKSKGAKQNHPLSGQELDMGFGYR